MEAVAEEPQKEGAQSAPAENVTKDKPTPTPGPAEQPKKSKREDRSKRDDKYVEQFTKAINSASSVDEKITIATQKYAHMVDDNKKMQFYIKQSEKRHMLVMKEKEQLQHEFNKTVLVKSKLENLCRELQKQNKAIKEESLHKIREEEERRKETQAKFQNTLSEITALLQQNNEKNAKLRDDNISMTEKFKSVVSQYQLREQQVDKMAKQMSLEQQLSEAKLQKASLEHQAEKERLLAEMETLKVTVAQFRAKIVELQGTETGLRGQLAVYTDKYDEFQNALVKSNQVFGGFKEEMEKMSKKIKKLEKESLSWKKRWETSQSALLEMCGERQSHEARAAAAARQLAHMQSLCRTLQAERTVLLNTLKDNNIERPALAAPAPPPPAPPQDNDKVDAMAANCAQLRQSLAHLQSQLNTLTNKQNEDAAQPPKQEKPKKSKSKKSKKQDPKESESDSNAKESTAEPIPTENEPSPTENEPSPAENKELVDIADEKVDDKTLESLIQAINSANINLSDLEVGDDKIEEVLNATGDVKTDITDVKPSDNPDVKPSDIPDVKPSDIPDVKPSDIPHVKPSDIPDVKSSAIPDVKSSDNNDTEKIEVSEVKPTEVIAEVKPSGDAKPVEVTKNEVKTPTKNKSKGQSNKVESPKKQEPKVAKEVTNNEIKQVDTQVNGA